LSQLLLRGFVANVTLSNTKGVDILAFNRQTQKMFRIEVKTKNSAKNQANNSTQENYGSQKRNQPATTTGESAFFD
jgi:hypothetical protein